MKCSRKSTLCIVTVVALATAIWLGHLGATHVSAQVGEHIVNDEEPEFDDDWRDEEDERFDLEELHEEFGLEIVEYEVIAARVNHLADIAADEVRTAAYAIESLMEIVEPEVAVRVLRESLDQAENVAIQRIIRLNLVELYAEMERPRRAADVARELISDS